MGLSATACRWNSLLASVSKRLESLLLLAIRLFIAEIFLVSGWNKLQNFLNDDWASTVFLFEEIHPVPYLPADIAAILGTGGELLLGGLLLAGLLARASALGLIIMVGIIEVSLGADATTELHIMWALLLAVVLVRGAGVFSVDMLLGRLCRRSAA